MSNLSLVSLLDDKTVSILFTSTITSDSVNKGSQLNRSMVKHFSIKDLERYSGIKAHTIRIWELRYNVLTPVRSIGNVRHYSLADVERILNISLLQKCGLKISTIVNFSPAEIDVHLQKLVQAESMQIRAVNHLILYMYSDIEKFEEVLDSCVLSWGIDLTIEKVIFPFLEKIQLLSYKDKSYQTHFVVTAIRKKLILGIEKEKSTGNSLQSALLFLQKGEHYDLLLLYITYLLKRKGVRLLYLGTDISTQNLISTIDAKKPDMIYTYISQMSKSKLHVFAGQLVHQFPGVRLHAVTSENVGEKPGNVEYIYYKTFDAFINNHRLIAD